MAPGLDLLGIGKKKSSTWSEKIKTGDRGIRNNDFLVSDLMDTLPPHPDQSTTRPVTASTSSSGHSTKGKGSPFSNLPVSDDSDPFAAGASRRASPRQVTPRLPSQNTSSRRNSESTTIKPAKNSNSRNSHQPLESTSTVSSSTSNDFSPNSSRDWDKDISMTSNPGLNILPAVGSNFASQSQYQSTQTQRQSIARVPPPSVDGRPVSSGSNIRPSSSLQSSNRPSSSQQSSNRTSSSHQTSKQNNLSRPATATATITQLGGASNGENRYSVLHQNGNDRKGSLQTNPDRSSLNPVNQRVGALPPLQTDILRTRSPARSSLRSPQDGFPSELLRTNSGNIVRKDDRTPSPNRSSLHPSTSLQVPGSSSSRRSSQRVQPPPRPSSDELATSDTSPSSATTPLSLSHTTASNKSTTSTVPSLTESQAIRLQYMATALEQLPPNSNFLPQRRPPEPPRVRRGSAQDQQSSYSRESQSRPMSSGTERSRPSEPSQIRRGSAQDQQSTYSRESQLRPMSAGTERSRPPKSPDKKPKRSFQPPPPSSSRDKNPKAAASAKPIAPRSPPSKPVAPRSANSQTKRRHASAESFMSPPLNQNGDPIILSRREPEPVTRPTSPFDRPTSPFKRPTSPVQWVQRAFRRNSQPVMESKRMSTAPGNLDTIHERRALTPEPRPLGRIRSRSPPPTAKSMPEMGRGGKKNKRLSAAALFATVFGFKGRRRGRRQNAARDVEISGPVGAPIRPLGVGAGVGPLPVGRLDQIRPVAGGDLAKSLGPSLPRSLPSPQLNAISEAFLANDIDEDDDPTIVPRQKPGMSMAEFLNDGRPPDPRTLVQVPVNRQDVNAGQNGPVQIPTQQGQQRAAPTRSAPPPIAPMVQRESTVESLMSNDVKMKRSGMVFSDNVVMPAGRSRSNSGATQTTQATTKTSASSGRPQSSATFGLPNGIPNGPPGLPPLFVPPIPPPRASSLHSPESDAESLASGMRSRSGSIKSARSKLEMPPVPSPGLPPDAISQNVSPISPMFATPLTQSDSTKEVVQPAIVQPAVVQPAIAPAMRPDTMLSVSTDNEEFEDAIDDSVDTTVIIPTINKSSAAPSLHDLPGLRKPDEDVRGLNIATTEASEYSTAQDNSKKNTSISTLASFDVSAFPRASQLPVPDNLTDEQRERLIKAGVGLPGLVKAPTQNGLLTTANNVRLRDEDGKPPSPKVFPPRDSRQEGEFVFPDRDGEREFLFSDEELSQKAKILESPKSPTPDPAKSKRASWMPSWANEHEGPISPKPLRPTSSVFSMLTRPLSMWSPAAETEDKKDELVEPPISPVSSGQITTPRSSEESRADRADRFSDTSVASNTVASGESVASLPESKETAPPQTQKLLSRIDELEARIRELTATKDGQTEEQKVEKAEVDKSIEPIAPQGAIFTTPAPSSVFVQGKRMDVGELKREYEFLINQMDFLHRSIGGPGGFSQGQPSPESNASLSARSSTSMNGFAQPPEIPSKTLSVRPVSPFGRRPVSPAMSDVRPSSPTGSMSSATSSSYGRRISQRLSLRRPASPVGVNSQLEMDQMKKTVSRIEGLFDALDMLYKERVAEIEADSDDEKEYMKELAERKENPEEEYSDDEFEELTDDELDQARQEREQQRKRLQEFGSWLDTTKDNCRNLQSVLGNAMDEGPGLYMPSAASTNEGNMLSMMSLAAKLGNASPPKRMSTSFSPRNSGIYGGGQRNSLLSRTSSDSSTTLSKRGFGFGRPGSRTSMSMPRGDIPARRESLLYGTYRPRGLDAVAEEKKVADEQMVEPVTEPTEDSLKKEDTVTPATATIATIADDPQRNAALESYYLVAIVVMAIAVVRSVEYILPAAVSNIANGLIGGTTTLILATIGKILGAPHFADNVVSFGAYLPLEHRAEWVATAVLVAWGWAKVARVANAAV